METVSTEYAMPTLSSEQNQILAEELNDDMTSSVLPVTIFVGIEIVFGFLGNLLILYVFLVKYHSCNFKYFVLCLAFIDITSTLTTMPGEIVTQVFWFVYPVPLVCKIKSFFNVFTVCGSAFCLLLIAVDRFRKICRPLEWQVKHRMAIISCFVLLFVSFIMALPCAILWGTHSYQTIYKGQVITVTVCEKDEKYLDTDYPLTYIIIVETVISLVLIILFVLYVFVCRVLLTAEDKTKSMAVDNPPVRIGTLNNFHLKVPVGPQSSEGTISRGVTSDDDLTTQESGDEVQDDQSSQVTPKSRNVQATKSNASRTMSSATTEQTRLKHKKKRPTVKQQARRVRRKTLIMFILTAIFIVTTVLYLTLLSQIANNILGSLSSTEKAVYFFFFRLYFINHAVNPILYGFLDPHFRRVLKTIAKTIISPFKKQTMVHSVSYSAGSSQN